MKLVCQCSHRVETHEITAGLKIKCQGPNCDCVDFASRPTSGVSIRQIRQYDRDVFDRRQPPPHE